MKNLIFIDKILAVLNTLLAVILLIAYLSYFISPNTFPLISFFSLALPVLIIFIFLFAIYWLIKFKKIFFISAFALLLGFGYISVFYKLNNKEVLLNDDVKIMSYNVRMFNLYKWTEEENIDEKIFNFINEKQPDILCFQEYSPEVSNSLDYPYQYVSVSKKNKQFGHAIFSKYPIVSAGTIPFEESSNTAIYADVLVNNDTVRVYNIHLQSLSLNPNEDYFNQENSEKFKNRVQSAFQQQASQVKLIQEHVALTTNKTIFCGDFNNTAFSWVYKQLKKHKKDAFEEAGTGFGKTYNFIFPTRIDFILADEEIDINYFKTFKVKFSDHFPILARVTL